jgi:DNA-binding MarR family transcriptional regulator
MKNMAILEKIIRLINKINQNNKGSSDYGTGHMLYHSEIHTIEAISNHEDVNASELANIMGITNGAITQVTDKLSKKGLIEQYRIKDNKKEVYYRLTDQGKIANTGHNKYHEAIYGNMAQYFDELGPAQIQVINTFLDQLIDNWPQD